MTYHGHVENGVVVLDAAAALPDGTQVAIAVLQDDTNAQADAPIPTLYERLKPLIGKAKGLPPDLALNHDHYLHGQPKK
jgi:hypothetical protein